ncbi:MAG: prolyl oligopeptidase family serine peptidase [Planctomycetota bacterium]
MNSGLFCGLMRAFICSVATTISVVVPPSELVAADLSRRPLEHKDYDVWNTLSGTQISRDGKWIAYSVQNGAIDGESTLHLRSTDSSRAFVIERASGVQFTWDSNFAVFRVTPKKATIKKLTKQKTPRDEMPKAKLQILELDSGDVITIDQANSFRLPQEAGGWVACLLDKSPDSDSIQDVKQQPSEVYEVTPSGLRRPVKSPKLKSREQLARERGELEPEPTEEKEPESSEESSDSGDKESKEKEKRPGSPLLLIDLQTGLQRTFPFVDSYLFSKDAGTLAFTTSVPAKEDASSDDVGDGVHVIKLQPFQQKTVASGTGSYKGLSFSDDGKSLAFMTDKDDRDSETSTWAIYHWGSNQKEAKRIATEGDTGLPNGWWVAPNSGQRFSEDGKRLYFDTAPIPEAVLEQRSAKAEGRETKTDDDEDQAKLDIWHWQDPQLQPQQLLQASRERNRTYQATYVLKTKRLAQLATREIPRVSIDYRSKSAKAVANTNVKYLKSLSWDVPGFQDVWLVDLNSGERERVLEGVKWNASMSPEGRFLTWFDAAERKWFSKSTSETQSGPIEISKGIEFPLQNELHDTPSLPRAYGSAGWLINDEAFLVYDRYDIWQLDPTGETDPICLTQGSGRENEIRFRYRSLASKQRAIDPAEPMMLTAFDTRTKASGFYVLEDAADEDAADEEADEESQDATLRQLIMLDESLGGLRKAEESDEVLFTRSTFRMCPDLWSSDTSFKKIRRISDINPQQEEYRWGDAELVHWKAQDGQDLDGILLKPDGFDPSKKYPLMVYFYERNSDNLHSYYTPAAGRSIICHSFYVSRGYLVFIPDIPYKTGEPGPSAANAILPGVKYLIDQGFVDEAKIGTQGHSWGGYQTAYLVTQTDLFACAESGAPVSNMTSAYGGIRWGSGLSRMFQYERTQSRIGEDLWSARDKYVANSPLFFADKINTPLLILHNDEDGAVPWYQGIELFVALRRLEKPAWMLNYNGNPHWVMGDRNRRDFAIRMQQFFDHYLMDAPEPEWMAVGVPAVKKGKQFGLELLEPESESDQ